MQKIINILLIVLYIEVAILLAYVIAQILYYKKPLSSTSLTIINDSGDGNSLPKPSPTPQSHNEQGKKPGEVIKPSAQMNELMNAFNLNRFYITE